MTLHSGYAYLSVETVLPVGCVLHYLQATVGKLYPVLSASDVPVRNCVVAVVISVILLFHRVVEVEGHSGFVVVVFVVMVFVLMDLR